MDLSSSLLSGDSNRHPKECPLAAEPASPEEAAVPAAADQHCHVGALIWSSIPGVCGTCGTSAFRCPRASGGPPWEPSDPQSRLHLRLLWGFYASSLPRSCVAMRECLRICDVSGLRAEAALLSLLSRGLGFDVLSLSAKRLAELCDIYDTGCLNPAWTYNHPLVTKDGFEDVSSFHRGVEPQQNYEQPYAEKRRTRNKYHRRRATSERSDSSLPLDGLPSAKPLSAIRSSEMFLPGHNEIEETARAADSAATLAKAALAAGTAAHGGGVKVVCFDSRHNCSNKQDICLSSPQGTQRQPKPQHLEEEYKAKQEQKRVCQLTHHKTSRGRRQRQREHQHKSVEQQEQQPPEEDVWERANHRMRHQPASGTCLLGHPLSEALAVCLSDLHAEKARLAPLFQEVACTTTGAAATGEDTLDTLVADPPQSKLAEDSGQKQPLPAVQQQEKARKRTISALAGAVATVFRRLVAISCTALAGAAASRQRIQWLQKHHIARLRERPCRLVSSLRSRTASAATKAGKCCHSASFLAQQVVAVKDSLWALSDACFALVAGTLRCEHLCIITGPLLLPLKLLQLLRQVPQAAGRQTAQGWETVPEIMRRGLRPLIGALQRLHTLHDLISWKIPVLRLRELFSFFELNQSNSSKTRRGSNGTSPWASPECLRRGVSTSTFYLSPAEWPPICSCKSMQDAPSSFSAFSPRPHQKQSLQTSTQRQLTQLDGTKLQHRHQLPLHLHEKGIQQQEHRRMERGSRSTRVSGVASSVPAHDISANSASARLATDHFGGDQSVRFTSASPVHGEIWHCCPDERFENGPKGPLYATGGLPATREELCQDGSSRKALGTLPRSKTFSRLAQAAKTTCPAAAGAAAASATTEWGGVAAIQPRSGNPREHARHMPFSLDGEVLCRLAAAARGSVSPGSPVRAATGGNGTVNWAASGMETSSINANEGDSEACWGKPPKGLTMKRHQVTPKLTSKRMDSYISHTHNDDNLR